MKTKEPLMNGLPNKQNKIYFLYFYQGSNPKHHWRPKLFFLMLFQVLLYKRLVHLFLLSAKKLK